VRTLVHALPTRQSKRSQGSPLIEGSFQWLLEAIKIVRIVEELMEIWPNEVCDTRKLNFLWL